MADQPDLSRDPYTILVRHKEDNAESAFEHRECPFLDGYKRNVTNNGVLICNAALISRNWQLVHQP